MSNLCQQAQRLATTAVNFNHPLLPAQGRAIIHESARLLHELSVQVDQMAAQLQLEREAREEQGEMINRVWEKIGHG